MRSGAERISDDQEGDIFVLSAGVDAVRLRLHHVAIGQHDILAVESLLMAQRGRRSAVECISSWVDVFFVLVGKIDVGRTESLCNGG